MVCDRLTVAENSHFILLVSVTPLFQKWRLFRNIPVVNISAFFISDFFGI